MRKTKPKKRPLAPDSRYKDPLVTRFVNNLMQDGKKSIAFNIFYESLDKVEKVTGENGYETWKKALHNIMPGVEVKSRRIGGSTFQIPSEVRPERKIALGIKWLIMFSEKRGGKNMSDKMSAEIIAASKNEGAAIKRKEDIHRMAEANKAFSHFKV
ncbi:MAG: 30S ribosomal protein S7 [Chitinophagaceae bacterium]|jgi:small subunit ribosomal protein S7|nr:MAG: 30S ribosomal protein S7 [Chitinophagaceae bacterium]